MKYGPRPQNLDPLFPRPQIHLNSLTNFYTMSAFGYSSPPQRERTLWMPLNLMSPSVSCSSQNMNRHTAVVVPCLRMIIPPSFQGSRTISDREAIWWHF